MGRQRTTSFASETSSSLPVPESTSTPQELSPLYDYLFKIILLGPSGVGKTCLLHRLLHSSFPHLSSQTIGVEFGSLIIKIGPPARRKRIKLQLWDTAGTERFRSVSRSYYRGAAAAVLCYDVGDRGSWEGLGTFLMDVRALAGQGCVVGLVGCKWDLTEEAEGEGGANGTDHTEATATAAIADEAPANSLGSQHHLPRMPGTPSSISSRQSSFPFDRDHHPNSNPNSLPTPAPRVAPSLASLRSPSTATPKNTATTSSEGRQISSTTASRWASQHSIPVAVEVSALSGKGVEELFQKLAGMILTKIELGEIDPDDPQSGIQYGDGWGESAAMGGMGVEEDSGSVRRRRGWKEDIFRLPGTGTGAGGGRKAGWGGRCC